MASQAAQTSQRLTVLVCLVVLGSTSESDAGQIVPPAQHQVDANEKKLDKEAPHKITAIAVKITRGSPPFCSRNSRRETICVSTSVDGFGYIHLNVAPPTDNRTVAKDMGFRLTIVEGAVPKGMAWPDYDVVARDGQISLGWGDGATREQEEIHLGLMVRPVDKAGNDGPGKRVDIDDPGRPARKQKRKKRKSQRATPK